MTILTDEDTDTNYFRVLLTMACMERRAGRGAAMCREDIMEVAFCQWLGRFGMDGYPELLSTAKLDPPLQKLKDRGLIEAVAPRTFRITQAGIYTIARLNRAGMKTPDAPSTRINADAQEPQSRWLRLIGQSRP